MESKETLFLNFKIDAKTVQNILKNAKISFKLEHLIHKTGQTEGTKAAGELLYHMSTKCPEIIQDSEEFLCKKIASGDLAKKAQLDAAFDYLKSLDDRSNINIEEFNKACGIGIVVTEEEIKKLIDSLYEKFNAQILEKKWNFDFNALLHRVRDELKWGDGKVMVDYLNAKKLEILGEMPKDWLKNNPKVAPKPAGESKEEEKKEEEVINDIYVPKDRLSKMIS